MAAVGVAQTSRAVVVCAEEQAGVGILGGVLVEQIVDRPQKSLGFVQSRSVLGTQVGLQVGHQWSGADSLPGNVAQHQPQPVRAESQEVVVVAPDLAGLDANTGVVETPQGRHSLREEPELDLFGDLELMRGAAL